MDYYEQELIRIWDLRNPEKGYNLTDGGGGMLGFKLSDETKSREKMSASRIGLKKCQMSH